MVIFLSSVLKTDCKIAISNVYLLVNFFALLEYELLWLVKSRFQWLKQLQHELLVIVILPLYLLFSWVSKLKEAEVVLEHVNKLIKQIVLINFPLNAHGQLIHEPIILEGTRRIIFIICPIILEIRFNLPGHLPRQWLILVEMAHKTQPPR